jgi:hypothetical protein
VLPKQLTPEEEAHKRAIYEKIAPRRRKFIDKLGYDNWDPFQKPFDPIDIRIDTSKRTSQDLMREFMKSLPEGDPVGTDYAQGVWTLCVDVVNGSERFRGMFDFVLWYANLLESEGRLEEYKQNKRAG